MAIIALTVPKCTASLVERESKCWRFLHFSHSDVRQKPTIYQTHRTVSRFRIERRVLLHEPGEAQMFARGRREATALTCSREKSNLKQVGFDDIFEGASVLAERGRDRLEPHRPA